jgi:hypothetical protein
LGLGACDAGETWDVVLRFVAGLAHTVVEHDSDGLAMVGTRGLLGAEQRQPAPRGVQAATLPNDGCHAV